MKVLRLCNIHKNEEILMEEKEIYIKPCPFCGSTNIMFDKCTKRARCKDCFATSGFITPYIAKGLSEEEAMYAAWNGRKDAKDNRG